MKTLAFKDNGASTFLFDDADSVIVMYDKVYVDYAKFIPLEIGGHNKANSTVYENITPPNDWKENKYLFDGATWTSNPEYSA